MKLITRPSWNYSKNYVLLFREDFKVRVRKVFIDQNVMGEKGIGKDQCIHWVLLSLTLHTIYLNIKKYIWNFLDWLLTNQIDCVIEWKFEKPMFSKVTDIWSNGNVNSNCHFPRISLVLCIYHFILSHLISVWSQKEVRNENEEVFDK